MFINEITIIQQAIIDLYEGKADAINQVYADLILKGLKTLDDVPTELTAQVETLLQ